MSLISLVKEHVMASSKYSAVYTLLLISLVTYEAIDKGRDIKALEMIPATLLVFIASSIAISYLHYLVKIHVNMRELGWKRLLFVVALITISISIYVGYEVQNVTRIGHHFITVSGSIGAAYASLMSPYVCCRWIADGFKK